MDDGTSVECHIKGNFRIRGIRSTNPVAVGDYVQVSLTGEAYSTAKRSCSDSGLTGEAGQPTIGWITDVEDRKNYIIRRATNLSKESHVLAANIDQVALLVTLNHPVTSTTFIDRFLATCEAYRVPAILIFNKTDLLDKDEFFEMMLMQSEYFHLGYTVAGMCAINGVEEEFITKYLKDKVTLLAGNSGVGKSTLLNALFGKELTRTGKISDAHDKGMHTTTFSEMYFLPQGGAVIDIPGIKGFGTVNFEREEVSHYFREIFQYSQGCKYYNCTHTNEPDCAVIKAVEEGKILMSRYESYISMLGDCDESKYR